LFQQDQLALRHPTASTPPTGQTVLVWGGSTSVGSNAIQLAAAAGYDVVTTASPRNHDFVRRLGASRAFDYSSPSVVRDLIAALAGAPVAGVFAVGTGSAGPSLEVALGVAAKRVSLASPSVSMSSLRRGSFVGLARMGARLAAGNVALQARSRVAGVRARFVWGSSLMDNEVGSMLWEDFLPAALAEGRYLTAPSAEVVGTGLEQLQPALDQLRRGVSAKKLVVSLP